VKFVQLFMSLSLSLWHGISTRGPQSGPSTSGCSRNGAYEPPSGSRRCKLITFTYRDSTTARSSSYLKSQLLLVQQASRGSESLQNDSSTFSVSLDRKTQEPGSPASPVNGKVSISYEEEDEHYPYTAVPATQSRTLKINLDLMLVS
jgi:hypothetical protein